MKRIFSLALAAGLAYFGCEVSHRSHMAARRQAEQRAAGRNAETEQPAAVLMQITCPYCGSTGRLKDSTGSARICSACGGCGRRFLMGLKEGESLCPRCRGMGKVSVDIGSGRTVAYIRCQECGARGAVNKSELR